MAMESLAVQPMKEHNVKRLADPVHCCAVVPVN